MGSRSSLSRWRGALAWALLVPALAWGVGQVASDRWWWSQWLLWIPAAVPLACALAAAGMAFRSAAHGAQPEVLGARRASAGGSARAPRRMAALRVTACAAAVATGASTLQWLSWGRGPSSTDTESPSSLRIVHLNPRWPGDVTGLGAAVMAQPADVYAISEAGALLRAPAVRAAADAGAITLQVGRFAVISLCPVKEARAVYDDGSIAASWIRFGATDRLPEWSMLMVDAPRRLRVARADIFGKLRAALEGMSLGAPDVVIGDMNATPGSVAVASAWPQMSDACSDSGRGLRATFPREFPLWAIDRCLVAPQWRATEWMSWDPGIGAHRGQRIIIKPGPVNP